MLLPEGVQKPIDNIPPNRGFRGSKGVAMSLPEGLTDYVSILEHFGAYEVSECGNCGCLVDEHWDFCARCGAHFMDRRYVAELCDLDV